MRIAWVMLSVFLMPVLSTVEDNEVTQSNNHPIVGILSQEFVTTRPEWKKYKSLISASYVKFLESSGARVVPLWINKTRSYYENIMRQINGVLFPGGSADFKTKNGYADAGSMIYEIAQTLNKQGDYFPLWGTCLGFELLAYLGANRTNPLTDCKLSDINLKLQFLQDYKVSKLYRSASKEVIKILTTEPVTPNFHRYCLTQENVTHFMGDINWRLITLNKAINLTFVSSMESRNFPAYGVQFHPEKVLFEWISKVNIAHSFNAVKAAQYFSNFFVNEARKSQHKFSSEAEEAKALIYNYQPEYTGIENNTFNEQIYFFEW